MADTSNSKNKSVSIRPSEAVEESLCDLCFEDALRIGVAKSTNLKSQDFKETSIRFCVDGLRDWYVAYVDDYLEGSLYNVVRDISWQWASFCGTNDTLVKARVEFVKLRKEIAEKTSYTDLMNRLKQAGRIKEFGYSEKKPFTVLLPSEAMGVISRAGAVLGIPFSKFLQVGMGWSLSTNRQGLYVDWNTDTFAPLFKSVMDWADKKLVDLLEVRTILEHRMERDGKK